MRVGAVGFIHQPAITNSMVLQSTYTPHLQYLQLEAHVESRRTSAVDLFAEIINVLRPLATSAEELHRVSLTVCFTEF